MKNKHIVAGIGELLWDLLPGGKQVGGAPCNFAYHAQQAGCDSLIISAVGVDKLGDELLTKLDGLKINCEFIQRNSFPTGTVTVTLNEKGHPQYVIHENVAWDNTVFSTEIESKIKHLDAVCFGSLGQRNTVSASTIQQLLSSVKPACLKVFDINLRQNFYSFEIINKSLEFADILKLNDEELPVLSSLYKITGDVKSQLNEVLRLFRLKYIVYTMGEKGSVIISKNEYSFLESPKVVVADTVGAGDSFTAVIISGLLKGLPLSTIHEKATHTAAYVCTQKGATPNIQFNIF
jgi:fructokinase